MEYIISLTSNKFSKDGSILGKVADFQHELQKHEKEGLNIYKKSPVISSCDRRITISNRHTKQNVEAIHFGSNSYLGTSNLQNVIKESIAATTLYGVGSGSVPLLTGTTLFQEELEKEISQMSGCEETILFSSGYTANLGAISGLLRPNHLIIHDKFNHASLIDATILSGAKMIRYKHNDIEKLERILEENHSLYPGGLMIATDGVFSMDGDIADIPSILALAKKYNALLLIDEAHATGVIGEKGAGTLSHFHITERDNIVLTGTLSKAIGTVGGYITSSKEIVDYLRVYARSNMFSTSLPAHICAAAIEVLKYMKNTDIVERLNRNFSYARKRLSEEGFNILNTETAIIPLIVGETSTTTQLANDFLKQGLIVNPIFPPAVPANLTRLRISIMAIHDKEDLDCLIQTAIKLFDKYGIKRSH